MIEGKNFRIIEVQDILDACNHLEQVAVEILKRVEAGDEAVAPFDAARKIVEDTFMAIGAAGVGAAIAKKQGGLVLLMEGCTREDQRAAAEALEKLRPINLGSQAEKGFTPGGIPQ